MLTVEQLEERATPSAVQGVWLPGQNRLAPLEEVQQSDPLQVWLAQQPAMDVSPEAEAVLPVLNPSAVGQIVSEVIPNKQVDDFLSNPDSGHGLMTPEDMARLWVPQDIPAPVHDFPNGSFYNLDLVFTSQDDLDYWHIIEPYMAPWLVGPLTAGLQPE